MSEADEMTYPQWLHSELRRMREKLELVTRERDRAWSELWRVRAGVSDGDGVGGRDALEKLDSVIAEMRWELESLVSARASIACERARAERDKARRGDTEKV